MDNENNKEIKIQNTEETKNSGNEKLQRITVSKEAQNALENIKDRVNDGFSGGKVNLTQMANWILLRFQNDLDEAYIKDIRAEHFDEVAMLESILKKAKESGKVPTDFKALLQKQLGLDEPTKRKNKVALT
ncbi:MAG: hypothetical protein BroJett040_12240 [Oligoflexia bacterium]|nr:MAG: hypothetical protein BroJett040_12240 [Oligoflexia bacterium]